MNVVIKNGVVYHTGIISFGMLGECVILPLDNTNAAQVDEVMRKLVAGERDGERGSSGDCCSILLLVAGEAPGLVNMTENGYLYNTLLTQDNYCLDLMTDYSDPSDSILSMMVYKDITTEAFVDYLTYNKSGKWYYVDEELNNVLCK